MQSIRASHYGLTLGVQTRLESFWRQVFEDTAIGNTYVNRNMIGAVVGVQPFGGTGLSGTGPKAGGPHYLARFANERTLTVNTTATGGNAALLNLGNLHGSDPRRGWRHGGRGATADRRRGDDGLAATLSLAVTLGGSACC